MMNFEPSNIFSMEEGDTAESPQGGTEAHLASYYIKVYPLLTLAMVVHTSTRVQ